MLDSKELFARLTELYRQVKSDITEGGTNTLYLAIGILKWKKAPAISLPILVWTMLMSSILVLVWVCRS